MTSGGRAARITRPVLKYQTMADRVTDAELEQALAQVIEHEAEQMVAEEDPESESNLRRWVEDVRRVMLAGRSSVDGMSGRPFDPDRIFGALSAHGVQFVVIGGLAAAAHGVSRSTYDADVLIETSETNLAALERARSARCRIQHAAPAADSS